MRENMGLYRGKRTATGELVYGALYKQDWYYGTPCNRVYIIISTESLDYDQALEYYEVDPITVGQYTGLTDRDGKKIFEGDIVRTYRNEDIFDLMMAVWYEDSASFVLASQDDFYCCESLMNSHIYLEIVGNIHDNPELLEVK